MKGEDDVKGKDTTKTQQKHILSDIYTEGDEQRKSIRLH